ncbi:MAG TPA: hypothetical protein VFI24_26360 [Pyrinomonadaceae bacterium]|nr:hypothetical protein [Pyrinomonadaceae bacterium]
MKRYSLWLRFAAGFQLLTALIHGVGLFVSPPPNNDTERQLFGLMDSYRFDLGGGFHRTAAELTTGLSICFSLLCLLGALVNWYLLRKQPGKDLIAGFININLIVFGICFAEMVWFTFLPPIVLTGLIFVFLILARFTISRSTV